MEPYEDLVKEYLDHHHYFVRQRFIYGGTKELDILAVKLLQKRKEVLVAEVRGRFCSSSDMLKLKDKLLSKELDEYVIKETGIRPTKRKIFYWLNQGRNIEGRAKKMTDLVAPDVEAEPLHKILKELKETQQKNTRNKYSQTQPIMTILQLLYPENNDELLKK